jgi:UDP-N-acetylglucosamine--N-acetylmuramyl-(pentapeptide) pyrophosphoryl-undecaprenol N-acetylglucosamine transferase
VSDVAAARARFNLDPHEACVLVFGGSLGARTINEAAVEAFAAAPFRVLHAAGTRDHAALVARVDGDHYDLRPYIDDLGQALAACDLCVARAGGSIFEIAAAGKPAILVPYPYASADHQTANAHWMADAGAAIVVPDAELTAARLGSEVGSLLGDPSRLASMASASASLARPHAAQAVADAVLAAAATRRERTERADGTAAG